MCRKVQITTTKSYQNDVRKSEWTQFTFWIHVPGVILSRLVHVIHEKIDGFSLNQASTIHCNLTFIFCHSKSRSKMGCKHCLFLYLHTFSALCLWCDETPCTLTAVMIILQFATSSLLFFLCAILLTLYPLFVCLYPAVLSSFQSLFIALAICMFTQMTHDGTRLSGGFVVGCVNVLWWFCVSCFDISWHSFRKAIRHPLKMTFHVFTSNSEITQTYGFAAWDWSFFVTMSSTKQMKQFSKIYLSNYILLYTSWDVVIAI